LKFDLVTKCSVFFFDQSYSRIFFEKFEFLFHEDSQEKWSLSFTLPESYLKFSQRNQMMLQMKFDVFFLHVQ